MEFRLYDDELAPRSFISYAEVIHKDGSKYTTPKTVYIPVLTISKCGQLILTKWLPEERRWNCYAKDENPKWICTLELPEPLSRV